MAPKIILTAVLALTAFTTVSGLGVDECNNQCHCPKDNNGSEGTLTNVYPAYQCAYPGGACTWDKQSGRLFNIRQTNCPCYAPWTGSCPKDNNHDSGNLINQPMGFECSYKEGTCMVTCQWDVEGALVNIGQKNCPTYSKCT